MDYVERITLSKEKISLWENTLSVQTTDNKNVDWNNLIDSIDVSFENGAEVKLNLYKGYIYNQLLIDGKEVDSFELSDEFSLGDYTFHHEKENEEIDNYTVILAIQ